MCSGLNATADSFYSSQGRQVGRALCWCRFWMLQLLHTAVRCGGIAAAAAVADDDRFSCLHQPAHCPHLCSFCCCRRTDWFDDRNEALLGELLQAYPQVRAAAG